VIHDHGGSMPPKHLDTALDLIEIERTHRAELPDARHPMDMAVGDHHIGPRGTRAVEVSCRRDVCTSARGEHLLVVGQAIANSRLAIPHKVVEVGHRGQRRLGKDAVAEGGCTGVNAPHEASRGSVAQR
jgi:hypothetical protein